MLEGQEIEIAAGYRLVVEGLVVPDAVVGLDVGLDEPVELSASCYSLVVDGGWRLLPEFAARARAWFWTEEGGWRARVGRAPAEPATPGMAWEIDGRRVSMVAIPVTDAGTPSTQRSGQPLRLVLRSDTVRVDVGERVVHLDGKPAEIVWELHEMGRVAPISALAAELWRRDPADADVLRRRLDRHLAVLRSKLRGRGVRSDLVRATGTGLLELVINPGDTVEVDEPG